MENPYIVALQSATAQFQKAEELAKSGKASAFDIVESVGTAKKALTEAVKAMPKLRKVTRRSKRDLTVA